MNMAENALRRRVNANPAWKNEYGNAWEEIAKTEEELKLSKVRNLIRFIKELGSISIFEDLLQVIRRETRKLGRLGDPILILQLQPVAPVCRLLLKGYDNFFEGFRK